MSPSGGILYYVLRKSVKYFKKWTWPHTDTRETGNLKSPLGKKEIKLKPVRRDGPLEFRLFSDIMLRQWAV